MDRITIITAGPVGLSIGLGLKRANLQNTEILGTSGYRDLLTKGSKMGAFDRTSKNLKSALEGAQLVILDAPAGETRELMEAIGPILEKGCVITDTGTNKVEVLEWAKEYYSDDINFVAGRPQPKEPMSEIEDASVEVFEGTTYCIIPSERANPEAVKTVTGLVEILGAQPLFIDALEHDSYSSAAVLLPRILSSALVGSVSSASSWREIARVAGAEFRTVSHFAREDPEHSAASFRANAEPVRHWINQAITELINYRDQLDQEDGDLAKELERAREERIKWEVDAVVPEVRPEIPTIGQSLGGMFFGRRLTGKIKKINEAADRYDNNDLR